MMCTIGYGFTQSQVPKKGLYEVFTASTCGPCASQGPVLDAVLNDNPGEYSLIKYQMSWPDPGDPYYTAEGGVRKVYYGVGGVPALFINSEQLGLVSDMTQEIFDSYAELMTDITIEISANINADNEVSVSVDIESFGSYNAGLKLHTVVVEKVTTENVGSNGEVEFHNVMMKMLPDENGTSIPALTSGYTGNYSFNYDMDETFMEQANDLAVIVFIQDDTDKSVIQSETADVTGDFDEYTLTFNIQDSNGNTVDGAEVFLDSYGTHFSNTNGEAIYEGVLPGTYSYEIKNSGLSPVTGSVDIIDSDVSVDIIMEIPDYCFYEDFEYEIPETWTTVVTSPDYLYYAEGHVNFFCQSSDGNEIMLISPEFDLSEAVTLNYEAGESSPYPGSEGPVLHLGTVTSPDTPESFTLLTSVIPGSEMEEYSFDMTTYSGTDMYLAFSFEGLSSEFYSLDNVKISCEESAEEYNVNFVVTDEDSNPLEGVAISFNNNDYTTSVSGEVQVDNISPGNYTYEVSFNGFLPQSDEININEDVTVEIQLVVDGIEMNNKSNISIFPNPGNDLVTILSTEEAIVSIYDISGKLQMIKPIKQDQNQINISSLNQGTYFVVIQSGKSVSHDKLIIGR